MTTKWEWTDHIKWQLIERKLSQDLVETVINNPDDVVPGKLERKIYQKKMGDKLIRVVTEGDTLITVYCTDKIKKYLRGENS